MTIGYNDSTAETHILSTDDYFVKKGVYLYDPRKLSEAHGWNHNRAFQIMSKGFSPVIIDNTNTQMWEMKPYAAMATDYGYILEILEPDTHWCFNEKELGKRNVHNIPKSSIRNMMDRYEKNVTPAKLLNSYGCKYKLQKPPQFRLHPPLQQVTTNRMFSEPFNGLAKPNTEHYLENKHSSSKYARIDKQNGQASKHGVEVFDMFSGSEASISKNLVDNEVDVHEVQSSSVDDILMSNDTSVLSAPVLKPVQTCKIKQSMSLFDNISAWGIDANALRSWDIVIPLEDNKSTVLNQPIVIDDDDVIIETTEASTMTDETYFNISKNISVIPPPCDIKILTTCNRDINRKVPPKPPGIRKKIMIDKSCNTEEIYAPSIDVDHLVNVFPNINKKSIQYWYEMCNRDFESTMELLLLEKDEIANIDIDDLPKEPQNIREVVTVDSDSSSSNEEKHWTQKRSQKQKRKTHNSGKSQDLKKQLESKFTISDDYYSEKLLQVKSRQSDAQFSSVGFALQTSESAKSVASKMDVDETNEDSVDSDDVDSCSSSKDEPVEDIQTVELNFGDHFVKQLENIFGDLNLIYPKGFLPVVQLPKTLARQIYAFYIESVYQQVETQNAVMADLLKEDEEFAKKLQEDENNGTHTSQSNQEPITIPEIIKEQKELSKAQREADKWKDETPDTLAARLTREKLFNSFPNLDRDTLVEVLHAHQNIYSDTLETLLESTGTHNIRSDLELIKHPPIEKEVLDEMWEDHHNSANQETEDAPRSASNLRAEANGYLEKRTRLYEKAKKYHQTGMREVAQFYSFLAMKQTKLYEYANSLAATAFLDEHSKRLEDFNTLDLHYLFVKEAIPHLDIYLDRNINLLRGGSQKNWETLQIITGRGKNSKNGVAKLRPAVMERLKQRHIGYQQLNPGLIMVKITRNCKLTNELF
ncbi:NEDD4-binding protein 2 isoform X2 [Anthonomus grandis grandis]|nr:NEDD4-binding protein 2 isoform X2 [Anthonomus grandis grandis]